MTKGLYIRIDEALLRSLDRLAKRLGYNRSEAIRESVRRFIAALDEASHTHRMRGIVKSKLSLRELEEAYEALR